MPAWSEIQRQQRRTTILILSLSAIVILAIGLVFLLGQLAHAPPRVQLVHAGCTTARGCLVTQSAAGVDLPACAHALVVYSGPDMTGNALCFTGPGRIDLASYAIGAFGASWDKQVISFQNNSNYTGWLAGDMDIHGNQASYDFAPGAQKNDLGYFDGMTAAIVLY